ncbi:MAG: hypothetical protein AB7E42_11140 [Anaerotignaceae bacterium]
MSINKKIAVFGTVTALIVAGTIYSVGAASSVDPGSSADPIVTKSYVDESIANLLGILNTSVSSTGTAINEQRIVDNVMAQIEDLGTADTSGALTFEPVQATQGQIVVGKEGAEIILRSGTAISYCTGVDGIIDTSTGAEYFNGTELEKNHLIIIPRADGRGAVVTSQEAWFIIKGGYEIK